jgi:hypothetical protein
MLNCHLNKRLCVFFRVSLIDRPPVILFYKALFPLAAMLLPEGARTAFFE